MCSKSWTRGKDLRKFKIYPSPKAKHARLHYLTHENYSRFQTTHMLNQIKNHKTFQERNFYFTVTHWIHDFKLALEMKSWEFKI